MPCERAGGEQERISTGAEVGGWGGVGNGETSLGANPCLLEIKGVGVGGAGLHDTTLAQSLQYFSPYPLSVEL